MHLVANIHIYARAITLGKKTIQRSVSGLMVYMVLTRIKSIVILHLIILGREVAGDLTGAKFASRLRQGIHALALRMLLKIPPKIPLLLRILWKISVL